MKEHDLRLLVENRARVVVTVEQTDDGFAVVVNSTPLESARQDVRRFARLDTAAKFLGDCGVTTFTVRLT